MDDDYQRIDAQKENLSSNYNYHTNSFFKFNDQKLPIKTIDNLTDDSEDKSKKSKFDLNNVNFFLNVYDNKKRFNLEATGDEVDDQLLQISLPDKIMIYDLKHKSPKEVQCIFDTSFFASQ